MWRKVVNVCQNQIASCAAPNRKTTSTKSFSASFFLDHDHDQCAHSMSASGVESISRTTSLLFSNGVRQRSDYAKAYIGRRKAQHTAYVALDQPFNCFNVGTLGIKFYFILNSPVSGSVTENHALLVPHKHAIYRELCISHTTHGMRSERIHSFQCNDFETETVHRKNVSWSVNVSSS